MSKRLKELAPKFSAHYPRKKNKALHELLGKLFERIREQEATITHLQQFAPPGFSKPTRENADIDGPLVKWGQGDSEKCWPAEAPPEIPPSGGGAGGATPGGVRAVVVAVTLREETPTSVNGSANGEGESLRRSRGLSREDMDVELDKEIDVVKIVIKAIENLNHEQRERVVRTVATFYNLDTLFRQKE